MEELTTEVTEDDIKNGVEDEFGVVYSRDGKKLLTNHNRNLDFYEIKIGTLVICNDAFNNSGYLLRQIIIPPTILMIGTSAFKFCESLQQIEIPKSVTLIDEYAFSGCTSIQEFVIPDSINKIEDYLFYNCRSLQKIVIPDSVTTIGICAFCNCESLKQIFLSDSVTTIEDYAFNGCSELKYVVIPKTIQKIGNNPFSCCWNIDLSSESTRFIIDNNCLTDNHKVIISYIGNDDSIEIPNTVTTIGDSAFKSCNCLKNIFIPNSVTEIQNCAFYECFSLQEIAIPNSVSLINSEVFGNCKSLLQIVIPNSVKTIGTNAFIYCSSLLQIIIPTSVTIIGTGAFWGCESLQTIILPNSVKMIGDFAFRECKSLLQINIPDSVTAVGKCIFYQCDSLQKVIASDLVHRIKENLLSPMSQSNFIKNLKIKKLRLKNFRAFVDEEVRFDDFNCIIGKNDVGKSTIFAALEWFFDVDKVLNEQDLNSENVFFIEKLTRYGASFQVSIEVYFSGVPFIFEKNNKDYFDKEGCVCVKKEMTYSKSDNEEKIDMNYFIKRNIFKQIRGLLYEEEWQEHRLCKILVNSYNFCLYTSLTSLNDYLNNLLNIKYSESIEDTKSRMAKDLSEMLAENNLSEKIRFKKNESIDLFTNDNLLLSSGNIPLKNRGEGIKLKIKNAVFKILTDIQNENKNTIFAFEEPESHLHPSAQIEMYDTIKKLSENPNYQVIITTHSPYIVKHLSEDGVEPIIVERDDNLKVSRIRKLDKNQRILTYDSMNEINYFAFDYASEEFHQELYAHVEMNWAGHSDGNRLSNLIANVFGKKNLDSDIVLKTLIDDYNNDPQKSFTIEYNMNSFISADEANASHYIPTCVRNSIDHPCEDNKKWKQPKIVALSIKILLEINRVLNTAKDYFIHRISEISNLDSYGDKFTCSDCDDTTEHSVVFWVSYAMLHKKIKKDGKKGINNENERLLSNQSYLINALRLIEPNWKEKMNETNYD